MPYNFYLRDSKATPVKVRAYWEALGHFITWFSEVETTLQMAMWRYANVPYPIAQAVFSGVRIDAAMSLINRIAEAEDWDESERGELRSLFQQLGLITKVRNDILHYGVRFTRGERAHVTNRTFAHIPGRVRRLQVSAPMLDDMSQDLMKILAHIIYRFEGGDATETERARMRTMLERPWLYKPVRRGGRSKPTPKTPRSPRLPRKSYPG